MSAKNVFFLRHFPIFDDDEDEVSEQELEVIGDSMSPAHDAKDIRFNFCLRMKTYRLR